MMGHPTGLIYGEANRGGSHFATHVSKNYGQRQMGTFSHLVLTLVRRLLRRVARAGLSGQRCLTTARKTAILRTGLEPIMLGILSQFLLEAEGSCKSEGLFE